MATPTGWENLAEVPTPFTELALLPAKVVTSPLLVLMRRMRLFDLSAT